MALSLLWVIGFTTWARAATTLDLSVNGVASRAPDALTAQLTARASAATAAEAQDSLNKMIIGALHEISAVKAISVTTSSYNVSPVYPQRTTWEARQNLDLTIEAPPESQAAKPMLALIGQLQQSGLMLESLTGTLTLKAKRQAEQAAIKDAVKRLEAQADTVAKALGDQSGSITQLHLNVSTAIRPLFRSAMVAAAPSVRAAPVAEQVTLSGTVELTQHSH